MKELIVIMVLVTCWGVICLMQTLRTQRALQEVLQNQRQIIMLLAPEYKNAMHIAEVPADKMPKQGLKRKGWGE